MWERRYTGHCAPCRSGCLPSVPLTIHRTTVTGWNNGKVTMIDWWRHRHDRGTSNPWWFTWLNKLYPGRDCTAVVFWFGYRCISVILNKVHEKSKRITVHCLLPRAALIVSAAPRGRSSAPRMWGRMLKIVSFPSGVPINFSSIALPSGEVRYFLTASRPSWVAT